jgi:hypothetical protein
MNSAQLARLSSLVCLVLWVADDLVIARRGHASDRWVDSVLFLGGGVAVIVALAALGATLWNGRGLGQRIAAAVGAVIAGVVLTMVVQAVVVAVQPSHPGWAWGEINLWVLVTAVILLVWAPPPAVRRRMSDSR